jgi:hypothetical protein
MNGFGFHLYEHLRTEPGNLVISPASLATVMGRLYTGLAEGFWRPW